MQYVGIATVELWRVPRADGLDATLVKFQNGSKAVFGGSRVPVGKGSDGKEPPELDLFDHFK